MLGDLHIPDGRIIKMEDVKKKNILMKGKSLKMNDNNKMFGKERANFELMTSYRMVLRMNLSFMRC